VPRGPNLTPDEIGRAAEAYARTGSFSAAAAALGRSDDSAVRKALRRIGCPDLSSLHARAVDLGIRRARRALNDTTSKLATRVDLAEDTDELVSIAKGLSLTTARLEGLALLELKKRQSTLTRRKTRAEIAALTEGAALTTEQLLAYLAALPRQELLALIATLRPQREPIATSTKPASPNGAT
jgi:hypothetical protein